MKGVQEVQCCLISVIDNDNLHLRKFYEWTTFRKCAKVPHIIIGYLKVFLLKRDLVTKAFVKLIILHKLVFRM